MKASTHALAAALLFGPAVPSPAFAHPPAPGVAAETSVGGTAAAAPPAMAVLSRVDVAQAERAAPAGGQAGSGGKPDDVRQSSPAQAANQQPLGAFPTNEISQQPWIDLGVGEEGHKKDVAALQQTLTELQQLQLQAKQAHWNASGTLYYPLHLLLQEHYEGLSKYADTIAERLLALGTSADGRANTIVRTSGVAEIPGGFLDDAQILVWFTNAYKRAGEEVNSAIKATEKIDPTTSNLLQEVEHGIAKYQWQMRAQLQRSGTDPNAGRDLNDGKPVEFAPRPAPAQGTPRP